MLNLQERIMIQNIGEEEINFDEYYGGDRKKKVNPLTK